VGSTSKMCIIFSLIEMFKNHWACDDTIQVCLAHEKQIMKHVEFGSAKKQIGIEVGFLNV
jgi:hypothetical protein